jgi:hypothetical protein
VAPGRCSRTAGNISLSTGQALLGNTGNKNPDGPAPIASRLIVSLRVRKSFAIPGIALGLLFTDLPYTSDRGGSISLEVNGKPATPPLPIKSTFNAADPIVWRQWHHWNLIPNLPGVRLPAGKGGVTVHILGQENFNLAYFDFKPSS